MPIQVQCAGCQKEFRVPDKVAGKKIKCPKCTGVIEVPAGEPAAEPQSSESDQWHVKTGDGDQYGPVSKSELDEWVADGRIDNQDQLLQEGTDQWRWANEVYPDLGGGQEGPPVVEPAANEPPAEPDSTPATDPLAEEAIPDEPTISNVADPLKQPVEQPAPAPTPQPQAEAAAETTTPSVSGEASDRRRKTAGLLGILCFVVGPGSHQIYLGRIMAGVVRTIVALGALGLGLLWPIVMGRGVMSFILAVVTIGLGLLWPFIEGIMALAGGINTDGSGRLLRDD